MNKYLTASILVGALALSACTRPDRFGGGAGAGADGMGAGAGMGAGFDQSAIGQGGLGAGNPNSPEYFAQSIGDRVLFAVDQSTLSSEAMATLDGQAQWLMTNTDYLAVIEGHADEQGTREYNVALGARRANAAREYLISRGVPASRLRTISYGKERPVATCSDPSCYAQNRRAVTVIAAGALS
ncbi:MAG: peptidoglycan-associated lipoprotein Pal [Limimaricola soesokkakensis]|uniref:Peptidoglycan-associated lipoprotein n=1 Tax=Limimaricola soesokkakensis TaxID=1343159 RepID=A0A1X6YBR9_9RHOB|nr:MULTISPECIES: peptidoglycan-associated lipoprotein Pal [Limimaricola]MCZ4261037.1 peptidoglycan-associated lipoprotein Pal [Limimaricola sp. G21655-S1]PSK87094.1 peptidoglycan-associated lipoprotein [Limimaricola soesokkakensis]SLN16857.1 Outer membrane lipoprotein Omp16 precursor [Limimaricola soesokkakensis]